MTDRGAPDVGQVRSIQHGIGGLARSRRGAAYVHENRPNHQKQQAGGDHRGDEHFLSVHHHRRTHHRGWWLHPISAFAGRGYVLIYIYSAEYGWNIAFARTPIYGMAPAHADLSVPRLPVIQRSRGIERS